MYSIKDMLVKNATAFHHAPEKLVSYQYLIIKRQEAAQRAWPTSLPSTASFSGSGGHSEDSIQLTQSITLPEKGRLNLKMGTHQCLSVCSTLDTMHSH